MNERNKLNQNIYLDKPNN